MSLIEAIDANLDDLVDRENLCVDPKDSAANEVVIAWVEENPHELQEFMFNDSPVTDWEEFHIDMAKAFTGLITHNEFFAKYQRFYDIAKRDIMDELDSKIWNRYTDFHDVPAIDWYDYNGVKREDF